MEKFKGTKGEWFLSETQNLKPTHVAIKTNQNSRLICLISEPKNMDVEDNANAKLITKAPEMLEALQFFVNNNMLSVIGEEVAERLINEILE